MVKALAGVGAIGVVKARGEMVAEEIYHAMAIPLNQVVELSPLPMGMPPPSKRLGPHHLPLLGEFCGSPPLYD